jgi:hypothetical protein
MPVICADCCFGCSATVQRHILYSHRRCAANQVGMQMLSMTPRVRNGLCAAGPDGRQQAHGPAQPPRGWLPQPANRVPETSWQTPDQQFQPAFPIIFLILPRSSGQCRAGGVSLYMDSQKSDSFLHEPRRTSDAETVEKWDSRSTGPTDRPPTHTARDTAIRHHEVGRHHVIVLARGPRINYLVI